MVDTTRKAVPHGSTSLAIFLNGDISWGCGWQRAIVHPQWPQVLDNPNIPLQSHRNYRLVMTNSSPWKIPKINGGF